MGALLLIVEKYIKIATKMTINSFLCILIAIDVIAC